MSFCSFSKDNQNTGKVLIDNLFVTNFLPDAPENAIKVYLYGLYLCQNSSPITINEMGEFLSLTIDEIKDLFLYWEEYGIVSIITKDPFTVNYLPVSNLGNHYKKFKPEKYEDFTKAMQLVITNRMISISELNEYFQLMENSSLRPEALLMLAKYCVDIKGDDISYKYISAVAKDFISRGITTVELVEKELNGYFSFTREISELFRELKLNKKPDVEDIQLYKKWVEKYCFEHEFILSIIKLTKAKNIKKFDKNIEELYANKCFTLEEAKDYFKNKDELYKIASEINKCLGIYVEVLDNVVQSYTSPWTSMGYDNKTLIFIANYCFRKNKRSLEQMDITIKKLYSLGLITVSSIADYIKTYTENDQFIAKILEIVGVQRKPTDWDRENLKIWRSWNFSDEIILESAKLATGIRNFIPYMTSVLGNWKNSGVYTLENVKKFSKTIKKDNVNTHFENERSYTKDELDSLVDAFDDFKV